MTEAVDPRASLPNLLQGYLGALFSENWTLALASSVLSYEHLEEAGIPKTQCDALGRLCLAHGYTDLWLTRPGGEEASETLLQALRVAPPGPQRAGVVASLARTFAAKGLLADPLRWSAVEPGAIEAMRRAAANLPAFFLMSETGQEAAVEAGLALGAVSPAGAPLTNQAPRKDYGPG